MCRVKCTDWLEGHEKEGAKRKSRMRVKLSDVVGGPPVMITGRFVWLSSNFTLLPLLNRGKLLLDLMHNGIFVACVGIKAF